MNENNKRKLDCFRLKAEGKPTEDCCAIQDVPDPEIPQIPLNWQDYNWPIPEPWILHPNDVDSNGDGLGDKFGLPVSPEKWPRGEPPMVNPCLPCTPPSKEPLMSAPNAPRKEGSLKGIPKWNGIGIDNFFDEEAYPTEEPQSLQSRYPFAEEPSCPVCPKSETVTCPESKSCPEPTECPVCPQCPECPIAPPRFNGLQPSLEPYKQPLKNQQYDENGNFKGGSNSMPDDGLSLKDKFPFPEDEFGGGFLPPIGSTAAPPAGTPPAGTPPAGTPPAGTPPAGTPPAGTPPAGTPP
ncbi:MAG: hypothetical protein ACRCZ9_04305, partial [Fusobacteriaceae bacterium]